MYIVSAMFLNSYPVYIVEEKTNNRVNYDVVSDINECTTFTKREEADDVCSNLSAHFAIHPELKFSDVQVHRVKVEIDYTLDPKNKEEAL